MSEQTGQCKWYGRYFSLDLIVKWEVIVALLAIKQVCKDRDDEQLIFSKLWVI